MKLCFDEEHIHIDVRGKMERDGHMVLYAYENGSRRDTAQLSCMPRVHSAHAEMRARHLTMLDESRSVHELTAQNRHHPATI